VDFVLRTIDVLKFSIDWKAKNNPGDKIWKGEYRERAFRRQMQKEIAFIEARYMGQMQRKKTLALKKKFVNKHEKIVAGRNHIRKIYYEARLHPLISNLH
jgi:hypothetical protein